MIGILGAFAVLFGSFLSLASPIPGTGSSEFLRLQKPYIFDRKGFEIDPRVLPWAGQSIMTKTGEIFVVYKDTASNAKIQIQTESLAQPLGLEPYSKKWLKDYQSYGFDVLGAKPFSENKAHGYLVDLFFRKEHLQQRQAIFLKNKTVVTISCLDQQSHFEATLGQCNQILRTFRWL